MFTILERRGIMYLHIGNNIIISVNSIIGIFDMDNTTESEDTAQFLRNTPAQGNLRKKVMLPKSYILTKKGGKSEIYFSPMNTATLKKRINH